MERRRMLLPLSALQSQAPSHNVKVTCSGCSAQCSYAPAAHAGWVYDPHGIPFVSFYCRECDIAMGNLERANNHG